MSAIPAPVPSRVAIVGASSLRGKELKVVLEDRNFPAIDLVLLDENVAVGTLTAAGGEPTFIRPIDEESFERSRFAFFAGSAADAARNWKIAQRAGCTVIDLTGALNEVPGAMAWIPAIKKALPPPDSGSRSSGLFSAPGPATILAATLAAAIRGFSPVRTVMTFFPPVSERDSAGVEELESQTAGLLSFRPIEQTMFDAQVAFNMLSSYGPASRLNLPLLRAEISKAVGKYLAGKVPVPAIQLIQAPLFYGYTFTAFVELANPRPVEELDHALEEVGIRLPAAGDPPPNNVSVSGENEIAMAHVERDPGLAAGYWFWGAADNLRLVANNAVHIAEELLAC
ncbi:MAG: Asd/ArgC dimerization domain-containing protein [Candidatus Acidiferrales bacterium]